MQLQTIVSNRKINLTSDYFLFDLLPVKKYQECCVRIPDTVLLERGFLKDWLFNSNKIPHHPILKKKKQNLTPLAFIKSVCSKNGYGALVYPCNNASDIRDAIKNAIKEQKDYDFVKDKKVIEVTTTSNQILSMTLIDFLEYVAENKYSEQNFTENWKMIQQRVTFQKIDECYHVESARNNHSLEHKCQKIIAINTTETIQSTELNDDRYKKVAPSRKFDLVETRTFEGYKFFDTFLNKKFFGMVDDLVNFVEKNFKCIVESLHTKFVINKEREPFLVGISDIYIKPAKKIVEMKEFSMQKQKGFIKVDEYVRVLQNYFNQYGEKNTEFAPVHHTKKKCLGKFCKIPLEDVQLPPLLQQKLKIPTLSMNARTVPIQLRDGIKKRQRRVIEVLKENKVVDNTYDVNDDSSSQYQTSGDEEFQHRGKQRIIRICHNCHLFYFHSNRFFQLDAYNNLVEKKVPIAPIKSKPLTTQQHYRREEKDQQVKQALIDLHPVTSHPERIVRTPSEAKPKLKNLSPIKTLHPTKSLKTISEPKSTKKLTSQQSKIKLNPIKEPQKEKGNTLMVLSKQIHQRGGTKKLNPLVWVKKAENFQEATEQLLKKFSTLSHQNIDQFKYFAKKYYKDNLPQPLDRRAFSTFYYPHIYEFMNNSPVTLPPKQRIKKRPQMSLHRLSQLTSYPEIISKSQFLFDVLIVNEQTAIPFCIIESKIVNPDNIRPNDEYENIFIIGDIFSTFIEYITVAKQLLEQDECYNKRFILFNYPGQSHTIYNSDQIERITEGFCVMLDKLLFRLSSRKGELKVLNLKKDRFKFIGFGYGCYLLTMYLGSYQYFFPKLSGVMLINGWMGMPSSYSSMLENLLQLYSSNDPTVSEQAFLFYNKAIQSSETDRAELQEKAGLNPIRVEDRQYLLRCALWEEAAGKTASSSSKPTHFKNVSCPVTLVYGRSNALIPKQSVEQYLTLEHDKTVEIPNRIFIELDGGHDLLADNYLGIFRTLTLFTQ